MNLLRADLRALANLPSSAEGRRVTTSLAVGLGLLSLMSWWLADMIFNDKRAMQMISAQVGNEPMRGILGYGLLACPLVATWLGLATAQRQLFETSEMWLWRQAPIASWRGPLQILIRAVFSSSLWASALAAPFLISFLIRSPAGWQAFALVPVAIICCTAPLLASLLTVQIVLVRFLAGRWLKFVLALIAALASVGFTTWLLLNLFTTGSSRLKEVQTAATEAERLPWTIDAAATMLRDAANHELTFGSCAPVLLWFAAAMAVFGVAAWLFPRAHERYIESDAPLWRRKRHNWPASLAANVRRKEFAQVLQQPGALIGFLVFAVLVFALARNEVLVRNIKMESNVPLELRHLVMMLGQWVLSILLVLYAHMGRLAMWDGSQWPLYMASPASPRTILRGKLEAIAVFLLWPMLLVATVNTQLLGADAKTIVRFCVFAAGGTAAALGVLAIVGTWPRLMRPDADGQILQGGKTFLGAMVLVALFELTMFPSIFIWSGIVEFADYELKYHRKLTSETVDEWMPMAIGIALAYGALIAALGMWIGGRNYRRLLARR